MRFLLIMLLLSGCAVNRKAELVYFNDSEKVMSDEASTGVCAAVLYPCVVMSKGTFRNITGQYPTSGKAFQVIYDKPLDK